MKPTTTETPDALHLPPSYSIVYEIETEEKTLKMITYAQNTQGDVYYHDQDHELLFRAEGNGYRLHHQAENGLFETADDKLYAPSYVRERTSAFWNYADQHALKKHGIMRFQEKRDFLGRPCAVYTIRRRILHFSWEQEFLLDMETGICLSSHSATSLAGFDVSEANGNFVCIKISLENVVLPPDMS